MMDRLRIYLDTSVIGFLEQPLAPVKMAATMGFCRLLKENPERYEVTTSALTLRELLKTPEILRVKLLSELKKIDPCFFRRCYQVSLLRLEYLSANILYEKSADDLLHMAYAVYYQCDIIVSWNFKHFVNENTIRNLKKVNNKLQVSTPEIISPSSFLERFDNEGFY